MDTIFSTYWILIASIWLFVNGGLHDTFVLINHKGGYDRELLRLLMDGHVLILSGLLMFIAFRMMQEKIQYGALLAMVLSIGMIVYCLMIMPFLKSYGTMAISIIAIVVSIRAFILG